MNRTVARIRLQVDKMLDDMEKASNPTDKGKLASSIRDLLAVEKDILGRALKGSGFKDLPQSGFSND